jgi:hypothetical protein
VVGIGDSMLITPTYPVDTIHISYAGFQTEVSVKFAAIGIPVTPGQFHPCGSTNDGWYYLPIGCMMPIFPDPATYLTNCVVQGFTGITVPDDRARLTVSPNPTHGLCTLTCNRLISSFQITDITGKIIRKKNNEPSRMHVIDLLDLPDGFYFITCELLQGNSSTLKLVLSH